MKETKMLGAKQTTTGKVCTGVAVGYGNIAPQKKERAKLLDGAQWTPNQIKAMAHNQKVYMKRANGFVSKAQLRDRINTLLALQSLDKSEIRALDSLVTVQKWVIYASLAVIFGIALLEFGL